VYQKQVLTAELVCMSTASTTLSYGWTLAILKC